MNGILENYFGFAVTMWIQDLSIFLSKNSLSIAQYSLVLNVLIYFSMNGAQIFETFVFVPRWACGNLSNLRILNTEIKSANLKYFWILFHSIHEIIFLVSLLFCYPIEGIGYRLLILFILHMAVRVWTVVYFAGKIIRFQFLAKTDGYHSLEGTNEIKTWVILNYFRVSIYIGISILMIPLAIKILKVNG